MRLEDLESAASRGHLVDQSRDVQAVTANHHLHVSDPLFLIVYTLLLSALQLAQTTTVYTHYSSKIPGSPSDEFSFFLCILPDPLASIIGRCTLFT